MPPRSLPGFLSGLLAPCTLHSRLVSACSLTCVTKACNWYSDGVQMCRPEMPDARLHYCLSGVFLLRAYQVLYLVSWHDALMYVPRRIRGVTSTR